MVTADPRRPRPDPFGPPIDRRKLDDLRRKQALSEALIVSRVRVDSARMDALGHTLIALLWSVCAVYRGFPILAIAAVAFGVIAIADAIRWRRCRRDLRALTRSTSPK